MKRILSISLFLFMGLTLAKAQNTSSEDCLKNISLYSDYMKQGNIKEALPFWRQAFCCCPDEVRDKYKSSNLNLYVNGVRIMKHLVDNAEGELKEKYIDSLMWMYDERMKLSPAQEKAVLWRKAADYALYRPQEVKATYDLCRKAINLQQNQSESSTIILFMQQAGLLYADGAKISAEEVLNLYTELTQITDVQKAAGKDIDRIRETLDEMFLRSGVASCENIIALYTPKFKESPADAEFLENLVNTLRSRQCTTDKLYFEVEEALYKVKPSAESAVKLAEIFKKQTDYKKAQEYYNKALELETDNAAKAKCYVDLGNMLNRDLSTPKEARDLAKKALELDPNNGYAYFLLGEVYANEKSCGANDFEKRTVYWVAVDCYEKAKQVDPSLAETADKFITVYKQYYPSKEDIFFYNFDRGQSYTVNCWINERTTIRPRD